MTVKRKDFWNKKDQKFKIKHKFSKSEYKTKQKDMHGLLKDIKELLQPYISSKLKERMINIHLENLLSAVKHYFTPEAQRISIHINKKYKAF